MLHTKFRGNRLTGSRDFCKVFTIYGHGGHLGHVTQMPQINFRSNPGRLHIKFGFDLVVSEVFEHCGRTIDGQTPDHWYTISSPG